MTIIPLLLFFLFLYFLRHLVSKLPRCNASESYGPMKHPFIGCLIAFYKNRRRLLHWYTELLAASPAQTIVVERLGARRTVVTANPENVKYILKANFANYPKGKALTDILGDMLGRGIFNVDGELWYTQRKLASHEFSTKSLREFFVNTLEKEVSRRLLPILAAAAEEGRVVDMQDLLRRLAFDNICKVTLGDDPGFLDPSLPESEFAAAFETASAISASRGAAPVHAMWKMKRVFQVGSEKKLKAAVKVIHEYVMSIIRRRKTEMEQKIGHHDLLSRLISAGHADEMVRDMVISFIMAGSDTTSSALTWFFWLISCHPEIQEEVLDEVSQVKYINYEELKTMKVLEASLCESMRLYPPVSWDSKHAAKADTLPDGTPVGAGDRVTYFPYGMGRMERLWGKDWMEFDPWRWLGPEREAMKVSPYKFAVFQAGPRVCLGKEMAFVQMKYVAATVLRRFELKRVEKKPPMFVPLLTAHMAGGLNVVVKERSQGI